MVTVSPAAAQERAMRCARESNWLVPWDRMAMRAAVGPGRGGVGGPGGGLDGVGHRCFAMSRAYTSSSTWNCTSQLYRSWAAAWPRSPISRRPSVPLARIVRSASAMATGDVGSHRTPQPTGRHDRCQARQVRGDHRHTRRHRLPQLLGRHVLVVLGVRLVEHDHHVRRGGPPQQLVGRHRVDDMDLARVHRARRPSGGSAPPGCRSP